ncbi:acyltransferase family protein [Kaistia geumhonensis]|uniref:Peptidoglycan/LPS O-acetylase OafA/YrhL n=1 Tax=Kaistia geumhonensis TaxID=410839 RepID=A0ABU0M5J8_9HYPH|nr:acyltransferase family protein [Kaistia geumhonensis]MCX5478552.1 acyltransferase family protein [Kaistia geumhonensis]MDQ0516230.1 peptidoglycan/LPS O-acetylase OafA/YrhL [Kaistia geumhonensis]
MRLGADAHPGESRSPGRPVTAAESGYKPHVDGLRAISIVAVVAYHAGVPGVGGGFVGVDIFFVISGFLIINQIVAGLEAGRFGIFDFYARRALRILPAYFVMLAVTVAIAAILLRSPADLRGLARSAVFAPTFLSNVYFWLSSGYFDTSADLKPLLHTWSLAVEEQFYLVVPLLMAGLFALARRRSWRPRRLLGLAATIIAIASLIGCILFTPPDVDLRVAERNPAFFLAWWRVWEFVAGGVIAAAAATPWLRSSRLMAGLAGLAGLAMIALAVGFVGLGWLGVGTGTEDRVLGYPGYAALLPVLGAMLVILSGLVDPRSPSSRLLSLAPVVFVGQISYALYLWHWPLLVFGRLLPTDAPPALVSAVAVALAVLLAVATRILIELPILAWRRRSTLAPGSRLALRITLGGVAASVFMALAGTGIAELGYHRARTDPTTARIDAADVAGRSGCLSTSLDAQLACLAEPGSLGVLFGDSHALAMQPRLGFEAERNGTRLLQITGPGCNLQNLMLDPAASRDDAACGPMAERLDRFLPQLGTEAGFAIFDGYWEAVPSFYHGPDTAWAEERFGSALRAMLQRFTADGTRRMLVLGPLPKFERTDPLNCIDLSEALGFSTDRCGVPRAEEDARRAKTVAIMRGIVGEFANARFVDPIDVFCDARLCMPQKNGAIAFFDDHHVNAIGAKAVYDAFPADFAWAFGTAAATASQPAP